MDTTKNLKLVEFDFIRKMYPSEQRSYHWAIIQKYIQDTGVPVEHWLAFAVIMEESHVTMFTLKWKRPTIKYTVTPWTTRTWY